jgi:hypothetical protein
MFTYINSFDQRIMLVIQQYLRSGILDNLMVIFTRLGNWGLVWLFLVIALLIYPQNPTGSYTNSCSHVFGISDG